MTNWQHRQVWTWLLWVVLACTSTAQGQGTIVYNRPDIPVSYGPVPGFEYRPLDIDGDGTSDFALDTALLLTSALAGSGTNKVLAYPNFDGGLLLYPLQTGILISREPVVPEGDWNSRGALSACSTIGCLGPWLGLTACAGVEFNLGAEIHYGWIRIENFEGVNAGRVLDWAYETRPGVPILAGAVPEPSTWALLGFGILRLAWRRRLGQQRRRLAWSGRHWTLTAMVNQTFTSMAAGFWIGHTKRDRRRRFLPEQEFPSRPRSVCSVWDLARCFGDLGDALEPSHARTSALTCHSRRRNRSGSIALPKWNKWETFIPCTLHEQR